VYAISLSTSPLAELRPLEPWMAEEFFAHIERGRASIDPWIPWASFSTDLDKARGTLQRYADKQAGDGGRIHGIWLEGTCEIGVWTEPAGEGHGLITAAAKLLVNYAFRERGMHRIEWVTSTRNKRSSAVAQRLGMTLDGVLRKEFLHQGERLDSEVWSLLREEWSS
jgi:RimJ/RimL family protein N-acetyltransferase